MILDIFYITLIVFAILAIQTSVLRNAVIYLSVFSLLCSVVYLFKSAPDVAIAEAVIGCTLSTILYLVALKKYKIFTVYYRCLSNDLDEITMLKAEKNHMKDVLTKFASSKELQLDFINTKSSFKQISDSVSFDMIIFHSNHGIWLHGLKNSYQYNELIVYLSEYLDLEIHTHYIDEEDISSSIGE